MSYFSLSPSNEINSVQSEIIISQNNLENFVRQKRERDKTINTKQVKDFRIMNQFLQKYELYISLLLGRQLEQKEELKLSHKWCDSIDSFRDQVLPEAVLRFPNPDYKANDQQDSMNTLEAMLFIEKILKLDRKNIDNQIFLKSIEGVLAHLEPQITRKFRSAFTQSSHLRFTQQDLLLLDNANMQVSENNEQIFDFTQKRQNEEQFSANKTTKKVDALVDLIQQFKRRIELSSQLNIRLKIQEFLDIDYYQIKRIQPKKMKSGGFLQKNHNKWTRTNLDTKDLFTLIRQVIIIQLMLSGFSIKSFISEDGKFILCMLFANEDNLKSLAEQQKMKKKLNFCFNDLFSLEPVDRSFRPLRLNNRLWKPEDYDNLSEMFLYLRPKLINLIEEINFKRVAREINQSRINMQLFQYGKSDIQDDDEQPTDEQWFAYYQYLVHLEKEINRIRENKHMSSDLAALINQQLTPYELYILRNSKNDEVKKLTKQNIKDRKNKFHQLEVKKLSDKVFETISQYSKYFQNKINVTTKKIKIYKVERQAFLYMKIFDEALKVVNNQKKILVNFWNLIEIEKLDSYLVYSKPTKTLSTTMKVQNEQCWCKYQINEERKMSLFSTTERLKLVEQFINSQFQLNDLINKKMVTSFFCLNDHYELFGHQTIVLQDIVEDDYYRKKMFHLEYEWSFNIAKPWSTPIIQICEYYGEKIGLYFYYTTYYTKMLLKIAFIALAINSIQWIIQDKESNLYYLLRIIFAFLQIQWTNLFVVLWQKKQLIFNLQFGQSDKNEIQKERSNYVGVPKRSIENDQLNSISINKSELAGRMILATSALLFIIAIYGAIMIGLYVLTTTLKGYFQGQNIFGEGFFEILVTASINIVIIQFLDQVYELIAVHLTDFENQKSVKDYEESFIIKKYILYFISYVGPLIVIAFLNSQLNLYCKPTNCTNHVEYHFATMIIWIFFFKTLKIIRLIYYVKKIPVFKYSFASSDIYNFVEEQSHRQSYAKSSERYGTLEDYMEIFLQNTLLSIFGYTFPFSFFLLWVQNIAQMQADRAKFIYFLQRPWPQNNSSLGVWNSILEMINYVCILTNTGQMIIDYNLKYGKEIMLVYLTFLMGNFMMNFIISGVLGQIPFELGLFIQRQKYLIKNTIEQFQKVQTKTQAKNSENLKRFPLFKIFGSTNIEFKGEFQTISSEDELMDHFDVEFMEQFSENKKKDKPLNTFPSEKTIKVSSKNQKTQPESVQRITLGSQYKIQDPKFNLANQVEENFKQRQQQQKEDKKASKFQTVKQKSLAFDQVMNQVVINKYFQRRKFNYAFSLKVWKKQKARLQKTLEFLYLKTLLSPHKLIWTDQRIACRNFYVKRHTLLIRNLDMRKLKIFKLNQKTNLEHFKEKARQKFRKELNILMNSQKQTVKSNLKDEREELVQLKEKKRSYINKHTWLQSRKVVVVKVKGVWFGQYRKQNKKIPSVKLALDYVVRAKLIEKIRGQSDLKERVSKALGDPTKMENLELKTLIDAFLTIQNSPAESFELPLSTKHISMIDYFINKKKSEVFKFIVDSFRDTFVFDWQYQKLQQYCMQYFEEELFPIEKFRLVQQLNSTTWSSADEQKRNVIIQFFQIRHEQQLKTNIKQNDNFGVSYIQGKAFIRLSNIIDQVDDFYIKGYCVVKYNISSKITLKQVLKYRQTHGIDYNIEDLYSFIHATLVTIKDEKCGDINLKSFVYVERKYILFRSNYNDDDDIINLAQVIIEMILLQPVESAEKGFQSISTSHVLKSFLYTMIYEDVTVEQLIDHLSFFKIFTEIDVEDEIKSKRKEISLKDFLTLSIHQINMNYRMKQHDETLKYITKVEKQLEQNQFDNCSTLELGFQNYFLTHQYKILLSHSDISFMFNILLIIYIKFSTMLQLKKNFIKELEKLYHALMRSIESLDDIQKQVSLNVKLEQLTHTEQKILLRRKLTRSSSQIDLQSKDRFQLIENIRKNPQLIQFVTKVKKELQRYCLQFQALHSLYLYFNQNFVYSAQILEDIQKQQIQIIQQQTKTIRVVEDPEDLTPNQFNFDQQSPTLDAALKIAQEENFCFEKEFENCPNYCCQLLYYKYLQLIVWFDGGKETFQNSYIEFLELKINSSVFEYFSSQLKVLQRFSIPKEYIDFNNNCEIGKYIVVALKKWIEQSFFVPSTLEYTDNFELMWKQVMSYSVLEQSFDNRQILSKLLQGEEEKSLKYIILKIRIIQQLLHLDNYYPLNRKFDKCKFQTKGLKCDFMKNSLINRLKQLHNEISIESNSWFHSPGLLQFKLFYIMSLYFAFSKKHFENMLSEDNELLMIGEIALQQCSHKSEADEKRIKSCQLMLKQFNVRDLKSDPKPNQINKIVNSFIYINNHLQVEDEEFGQLKFILDKYGEQVKPSLIVLAIIQYYISMNRKELADILILQTFKLIEKNITLFEHSHPSFEEDLKLLQIIANQDKLIYLEPYDRLFHRDKDLKLLTEDHLLNLKYILYNQFFWLDIQQNIDLLEDQMKFFNQLPLNYEKLRTIYKCYILYLNATIGQINLEDIEVFIKTEFKEATAYSAIIKNILVRYYINMQDYELALPILKDVLNYLYSIKVSENFILKQETEELYCVQNNLSILSQIAKIQLINITPEDSDDQYFHLIDNQFLQENIISYIDIITNIEVDCQQMPKIADIFQLLMLIEDQTTQSNLFKVLSQLFFFYSQNEKYEILEQQVLQNYERQYQIYSKQRAFLKEKMNQLILLKELTEDENNKMTNQLNIITFILNIYESISRGLAQNTIVSWSIQAAEKALLGYRILSKNFHRTAHYIFPQILLLLSDNFIKIGQISQALTLQDQSEDELLVWFRQKKHPLKGYFLMKQGLLRPQLSELYLKYTEVILSLPKLNRLQVYEIIRGLFQFNKKLLLIFESCTDYYSLEQNLLQYTKQLDNQEKITVDIFDLYQETEPQQIMKRVMKISPFDLNGANILIDAQSILLMFNQNNQFTRLMQDKIDELI